MNKACIKRNSKHEHTHSLHMVGLLMMTFMLIGCDAMDNTVSKASGGLRTSYDNSRARLANYIYHDQKEERPVSVAHMSDFCYQVMMDIICYDKPQPDLHLNLVGVQGDGVASYQYDDYLPAKLRGNGSDTGMANMSMGVSTSAYTASSGTMVGNDITVSDLGGAGEFHTGTHQTPFYHSPSPVVKDSFGKPKESLSAVDMHADGSRSMSVPSKLIGR